MFQVLGSVHETWPGSAKHALEYATSWEESLCNHKFVLASLQDRKPICNVWSAIDIGTGHRGLTTHSLDSSYF